jgi:4-carboxymuconolactone decarboxylase
MKHIAQIVIAFLLFNTNAIAADRFPQLSPDQMTPDQKRVADAIMSGPRRSVSGPFNAWLRSPELADRLQKVGEYLRFKTSLPHRLNEFAILIAARQATAQYEWYAHYPLAIKEGLSPSVAADLAEERFPEGMKDDEKIVYEFCMELHRTKKVKDATFKAALDKFGELGVVELIGVTGYYNLVSMTLNVAQVSLPVGVSPPLPPLRAHQVNDETTGR